jgi:twitching motility protein PilJ
MYDGALNSVQGAPSVFGVEGGQSCGRTGEPAYSWCGHDCQASAHLVYLAGGSVLVLVVLSAWMLREAGNSNQQLAATGQALMQSQRLAKSVSIAMTGAAPAFADVKDSAGVLAQRA